MRYKIGVVTGTRAEYGILKPLLKKICNHQMTELCLIATGTHFCEKFGNTYREIENDGFQISHKIPMNFDEDTEEKIVSEMGKELEGFAKVLDEAKLDVIVLLGDRYEILVAATAATLFRIPIAHIHGGEVTEGAIDDNIRHAITKLSTFHFAATRLYADNIIKMGEASERVFNVGALGVENILNCNLLSRQELKERYGELFQRDYVMVTYHPVTKEKGGAINKFTNLLRVIEENNQYAYVFTYANSDPEGIAINKKLEEFVNSHSNCVAYKSMGQVGYLSALKYSAMVVGNSSSGIIEAPSFHIPTINIGNRQKGRIKANTIIDCKDSVDDIYKAFIKAKDMDKGYLLRCDNPYEGQNTSNMILSTLIDKLELCKNV